MICSVVVNGIKKCRVRVYKNGEWILFIIEWSGKVHLEKDLKEVVDLGQGGGISGRVTSQYKGPLLEAYQMCSIITNMVSKSRLE